MVVNGGDTWVKRVSRSETRPVTGSHDRDSVTQRDLLFSRFNCAFTFSFHSDADEPET
jgi:hypothetical protein